MVYLQVEELRKRLTRGQTFSVPSCQRILGRLKVKERKPVGPISQQGPDEALSLGEFTHYRLRIAPEVKGDDLVINRES
jgi:hypothetical protein